MRKMTEQELQALQLRIALLQSEEAKTQRAIETTRRKAQLVRGPVAAARAAHTVRACACFPDTGRALGPALQHSFRLAGN